MNPQDMAFAQALVSSPSPAKRPLKLQAKLPQKGTDSFIEQGEETHARNSILEPMEVHLVETVKLNLKTRGIGLTVFSARSVSHSQRPMSSEKPLSPTVAEFWSPMSSGRYSSPRALMSSQGKSARKVAGPNSITSPLRPVKLSTAYQTPNSKSSTAVPMSSQAILDYITQGLDSVEQGTKLLGEIERDISSMHETLVLAERHLESRKAARHGATSSSAAAVCRLASVKSQEITPAYVEIEEEDDEGMMMPPPPASASASRAGSHQI
jgi:hypothetical protein